MKINMTTFSLDMNDLLVLRMSLPLDTKRCTVTLGRKRVRLIQMWRVVMLAMDVSTIVWFAAEWGTPLPMAAMPK